VVDGKLVDEVQFRRAMTLVESLLDEVCLVQGRGKRG